MDGLHFDIFSLSPLQAPIVLISKRSSGFRRFGFMPMFSYQKWSKPFSKHFFTYTNDYRHITSDHPEVDFSRLAAQARRIEEKSSCFGAEHVRLACADLIHSSDEKHKDHFSQALNWMKNEFACTRDKLETFAQMERRIIRLEKGRRN